MSLLAPALLVGLALLAVPVLIHLTRRHRGQVTEFPSLMFLQKTPFRTTKRRHLRHPLLFALRCLAVALIVFAFARPFFGGVADSGAESARDVVLVLDVSGSMAAGDREAAAREAARAEIAALAENDRMAIVTFDDRASEQVSLTSDPAALAGGLDGVSRSDRPTRIQSGLQLATRILDESDRARREVVLISDFQRTGWEDAGDTRLPDGATLRSIDVAGPPSNVAVEDVQVLASDGERYRLIARVVSLSDDAVEDLQVALELEGRTVDTRSVDLEARGAATVAFDDVPIPDGAPRGRILLGTSLPDDGASTRRFDALLTDDELRFLASPDPVLDVALVTSARGRADRNLFLERALALADAPRARVARRPAGQLDAATLAGASAVVLNDAAPDDALAARLRDWVAEGGALFVALGPQGSAARWAGATEELLGGTVGDVVDRAARGGARLAWLDYDHPVFEVFATPGSGDFASARVWRYRDLAPGSTARVVARYDDGGAALVEHRIGGGRVLVWTSTLDRFWNDLALQPVFLPFTHRALRHLADYQPPERWLEAGTSRQLYELLEVENAAGPDGDGWVLVTPAGERRPIDESASSTGPGAWVTFDRAGFYRIEAIEGGGAATVAVNAPLVESDLSTIAPERVAGDVVGAGEGVAAASPDVGATEDEPRELWWPLLLLAALVLAAESYLANRLSAGRAGVT